MKKWKTLKALFGMLCAMFAAIGLFACKSGDSNGIANITKVQGASNLSFTDDDQWSDVVSSLERSVKLTCKPTKGENFELTGKDCNFTSTIEFDEENHCKIGFYSIKIQPKEKNPKNISREVDVEIVHAFEAEGEREVCSYCKATKTSAEEDAILHFGSFHSHGSTYDKVPEKVYGDDGTAGKAYTNNKTDGGAASYIEQFGTVQTAGGASYTMPTLTVGRLEKGMTITVKGTAKTAWSQWDVETDAGYYFPVIGIADRFLSDPVWEGEKRTDYVGGGTSVMVRGEGWVLYNGMDSSHADGDVVRMLAGLGTTSSGSGTGRNYASHEHAEQASDEKRPSGYVQGQIPSVANWTDWVAYSTGTISQSGAYSEEVQIELTWNYRKDGVVEIIYNVEGAKLVALVKVPDATMGYYDTILHGDYVDMHITSYERIETNTPSEFLIDDVTMKNYFEGETFDPATVSAKFKYEQTGDQLHTQALSLDNFYASEKADADPATASDWVSLKDRPMSASYEAYKAEVIKGGKTWRATFAKDRVNVVTNVIGFAYGGDCGDFKNNNTVGELVLGTDGVNITLTPKDDVYAQIIPDGAAMTGTTAGHRYVALVVKASGALGNITAVKSGNTDVPYFYDKTKGYLVLALTADAKTVTVEGLQSTKTVFDFGKAKGFNVEASVGGLKGWEINNGSNEAIVTFKAAEGATLTRVEINGIGRTPAQLEAMTEDFVRTDNFKIVAADTSVAADGTITMKVVFPGAKLAAYKACMIGAVVNGVTDFVYKIDYKPEFVENTTVDKGYYNFVSDGKIYLAKAASAGDSALTLNVNEGNDNVLLIDLAYGYANGKASFKNASLKGARIDVMNLGGENLVLIAVEPAVYGISAEKFGYQIKTDAFSEKYYAVADGVAEQQTANGTEMLVINEGSCLEKGVAGALNRATVNGKEVTFLTNLTEFGGSHKFASLSDGQNCQLCGETVSRARFNNVGTLTLHDNEFIEVTDSYANSGFAEIYNGVTLRLTAGSDWYWFRNDGYIGLNGYGVAAVNENVWSSLGDDTRTPNGKLDGDGEEIDEQSFMDAMKAGATFRIWAGYQDGTFTLVWRLYKKGAANQVTGYGTVYYEFTHKVMNITADTLSLQFGLDNATNAGNSDNLWWFKSGKIEKNMIESAEDADAMDLTVGNIENGFATVSATGGNAMTITDEMREESEIAIAAKYVKAVAVAIKFKEAYSIGTAFGKIYSDAELKNAVEGTYVNFNGDNTELFVTILLEENQAPGVYYIDLGNDMGSTKQVDIKLDLTAVSTYDAKGTVTNNASILSGGTVEIDYSGLPDMTGAKLVINGEEAVLASSMTISGVTAAWDGGKLTLTLPAIMNLTGIPQYTVALVKGEDTVVTNVFALTGLPAEIEHGFVREDGVYGYAEGSTMYLYLIGEKATGTDYLTFNANNSGTAKDKLLPYDLAYSLSGTSVTFKTANALTNGNITANYFAQGEFKVTQMVIDLGVLGIGADAAYYFDVLTANITDSATYYTVNTSRVVAPTEVTTLGTKQPIVDNSCTSIGSKGYEIKSGNDVVGYYGVEVVPSHTYAEHGTDATLFECSVCHAILASGNATGKTVPLPEIGGESIVNTGISVSFVSSGATGDWGSFILQPKDTGFALTLPNFDQWNHTVASADVSAELKAEAAKYKNANGVPTAADKKNGHEWNTFLNTECYVTITIGKTDGIKYYKNGELAISYAIDKAIGQGDCGGFAETFLGLTEVLGLQIAKSGCHADDALIQRGTLTEEQARARYEIYAAEKAYLPKPHTHTYGENHLCTVCGALDPKYDYPTYTTEASFTLGTDGTQDGVSWTGYTPTTGKYFAVQKGKKLTLAGTMKAESTNGVANQNYFAPIVSIFSGNSKVTGFFRGDKWIIDDGGAKLKANEGWKIEISHTHDASDAAWAEFRGILSDCSVTIEIDWTNINQIVVRMIFEKNSSTATQTYTITPATGRAFLDQYSTELGFESCYLNIASVTTTEA